MRNRCSAGISLGLLEGLLLNIPTYHSNTSMLDLRMTKEANGGFLTLAPKVGTRKVQRIVKFDDRVAFLGNSFKIGLGSRKSSLARGTSAGCKSSGRCDERQERKGGFGHFELLFRCLVENVGFKVRTQ